MSMCSGLRKYSFFALVLVACGAEPKAPTAQPKEPPPRPLFELHSNPWVNLHQRLIAEATANKYWHAVADTCTCARQSDGTILPEWQAAVTGYKAALEKRSPVFDSDLIKSNLTFALNGNNPALPKGGVDPALAKLIEPVFETYVRRSFPLDDERNRAWIASVQPLLAKYGADMATEIAMRFETHWPTAPIRVEVTEWAGFGGAYTVTDPILTTMSSADRGYQPPSVLEMLFHEALHGMDAILTHDLQMAFIKIGKREPRSLDHALIFYTAGALAKKRLGPDYVPYAYREGVWDRGWTRLEAAVRTHWQPWLDDQIDLPTALARLANASYD